MDDLLLAKIDRLRYFRELEEKAKQAAIDLQAGLRDEFGNPTKKAEKRSAGPRPKTSTARAKQLRPRVQKRSTPTSAKPKPPPRPREVIACTGCERMLRPRGSKIAEFPDTLGQASPGKCDACHRGVDPTLRRMGRPAKDPEPNCSGCGRAMRPYRTTAAERPDTVGRANATTCTTCAAGYKPRGVRTVTPCGTCERPMRPSGTLLSDWPDTVARKDRTICVACAHGRPLVRPKPVAVECLSCHRKMRPNAAPLAEWPDTVTRKNRTTCQGCAKGYKPKITRPERCLGCGYTLRPRHAGYRPGTVEHFKEGRCRTCHRKTETRAGRMAS